MSAEVIKEFLVSINYKVDGDSEKKFTDGMATAAKGAAALALAVGAAATAVVAAVARIASQFDTLYYTSQRTGASVQSIKGLGYAFSQLGGSASQAVGTLESFTKALRNNPGLTNFVKGIGVNVNQDKAKVLTDVIDKLAQKPYYIGAQQAEMLGISEESFNLMVKNRAELARYRAEYDRTARTVGLNNDEAAKASRAFNDALLSLRATATAVAEKIGTDLAPVITRYLNMLRDWIAANPDKIEAAIKQVIAVAEALITTVAGLVLALKPVGEMFQHIAETLTGKDGLQASMELFAVFIATTWLSRILGAFGKIGLGWAALLLAIGIDTYKNSTPEGRANTIREGEAAINREQGAERGGFVRGYLGDLVKPKEGDNRSFSERLLPKALGGKERPAEAAASTPSASDTSTGRPVLDLIAKAEGTTKRGYDDSFNHQVAGSLTDKTLDEIEGIQKGMSGSSAIGKYQFMRKTLGGLRKEMGLDGSEKFDAAMQDRLAMQLYNRRMKQAARNGGGDDAVLTALAQEWASFPTPSGQGYYPGQRASISTDQVLNAVKAERAAAAKKESLPPLGPTTQGGSFNLEGPSASNSGEKGEKSASPVISLPKVVEKAAKFDLSGITQSPALGSTSWDNRTSNTTMHQETKIEVNGASDPAAVGSMVERNQDRVNSTMLRNATGAVR